MSTQMEVNLRKFKKNDVHHKPLELVMLLNNIIDTLRKPPRKLKNRDRWRWTYDTISQKTWRNIRSVKKDMMTLILSWAPLYMSHEEWWVLIDKKYNFVLNRIVAKTVINHIQAHDWYYQKPKPKSKLKTKPKTNPKLKTKPESKVNPLSTNNN